MWFIVCLLIYEFLFVGFDIFISFSVVVVCLFNSGINLVFDIIGVRVGSN